MVGLFSHKNDRGYSEHTFRFMRLTIPRVVRYYSAPRMINRENMPLTGPCFIYANHSNNFDPFLINHEMTREPTAGVMTRYQFFKTLPRLFMSSIGVIPTSKYVPEPGVIREVMKLIDLNRMILIFPEGGRRWDGRPKPLIEATLKLFWKMRVPVHPVQIHGSYLGWPRWADCSRYSRMELHWLSPLRPEDFSSYDNFADQCREAINFDENDPPASTLPYAARKPALGIQRILYRCPVSGTPEAVYTPNGTSVRSRNMPAFHFDMNEQSRLIDIDGQTHAVTDYYDRITKMPVLRDHHSVIIRDSPCTLYLVDTDNKLRKLGMAKIRLTTDLVAINRRSEHYRIPVTDIRYISIEKNHKLMLTTHEKTIMVDMGDRSVLQWQDYLRRLQKEEPTVRSI